MEKELEFDGVVTVTVTDPDPEYTLGKPDDVVIYIDTNLPPERRLRIRVNNALLFEGTPGFGRERIEHAQLDGYYITQGE